MMITKYLLLPTLLLVTGCSSTTLSPPPMLQSQAFEGEVNCLWCNCPPGWDCYHTPDFGDCRDGVVGIDELLYVLAQWGPCNDILCFCDNAIDRPTDGTAETCMCCEFGDINRDHQIDVADYLLVLQWWGPLDDIEWQEWRCREPL